MAEWTMAAVLKTASRFLRDVGSNPTPSATNQYDATELLTRHFGQVDVAGAIQ